MTGYRGSLATACDMAKILPFLLACLIGVAPCAASMRKHRHFKPADAADVARELTKYVKSMAVENFDPHAARCIKTRGEDLGVGITYRQKEACFRVYIDLARHESKKGRGFLTQPGKRTFAFRPLEKPAFQWKLDPKAERQLETQLAKSFLTMSSYEVINEIILDEKDSSVLQSHSELKLDVYTEEEVVELVRIYYSAHKADLELWEDDGI